MKRIGEAALELALRKAAHGEPGREQPPGSQDRRRIGRDRLEGSVEAQRVATCCDGLAAAEENRGANPRARRDLGGPENAVVVDLGQHDPARCRARLGTQPFERAAHGGSVAGERR